ncbi:MAG: hypothetical protein A2014_01350 [Spirochaetes bacterium GWF1_49_6]|nr:MAG: hypothetical protein A2014_01350 [Spirochaetes bacterium GWF1_49_6]
MGIKEKNDKDSQKEALLKQLKPLSAKEAVRKAKDYFIEISGGRYIPLQPESVLQEKTLWRIVLSFYEEPPHLKNGYIFPPKKVYKEFQVDLETGNVLSMKFVDFNKIISEQ